MAMAPALFLLSLLSLLLLSVGEDKLLLYTPDVAAESEPDTEDAAAVALETSEEVDVTLINLGF
jgi:hypothetical protein